MNGIRAYARNGFRGTLTIVALAVAWTGCGTLDPDSAHLPRFHEGDRANLVVQFYSWNQFHILRPEYREDGFLVPVNRSNFARHLQRLDTGRDLGVVVLGINYSPEEQARLIRQWETLLLQQGFARVVCLRGNGAQKIDGLVVLSDTSLTHPTPSTQMVSKGT